MRHRGEHVGHFFVGDKADAKAFTKEDEEILTPFAAQAAVEIAEARTHRAVERARADRSWTRRASQCTRPRRWEGPGPIPIWSSMPSSAPGGRVASRQRQHPRETLSKQRNES